MRKEDPEQSPDNQLTSSLQSTYATTKTVAQGMMDIALLTANASQMRFVLEHSSESGTSYMVLVLIVASIILQVAVGISLILKGKCDLCGDSEKANRYNNWELVGVFMITIINVFITAFTSTSPLPPPVKNKGQ